MCGVGLCSVVYVVGYVCWLCDVEYVVFNVCCWVTVLSIGVECLLLGVLLKTGELLELAGCQPSFPQGKSLGNGVESDRAGHLMSSGFHVCTWVLLYMCAYKPHIPHMNKHKK